MIIVCCAYRTDQSWKVAEKLLGVTKKFDEIFEEISSVSYNFIRDLNQGDNKAFAELFDKYNAKITDFERKIPILTGQIREFGIF